MQKQKTYTVLAIIVLMLTVLSIDTYAQVVHFPDPHLRAAVAEAIGADPDRITVVALRRLTRLDAGNSEIENLEGLQHAPNLRLLDLWNNRISDLTPLTSFRNLKALRLGENALIDISPLSGLTNLQTLGIPSNRISDLKPLANLHNLEELVMDRNDITDISSLGRLTNLRILKMTDNGISDLMPLANLTNLEELLLKENRISGISSLANLTGLTRLELSSNNITDVTPLANLTNLKHLELQNNRITDITPLENLTNLEHLDTQNNPIFDADSPIVHIPDPNLRTAIREALKLPDGVPVTRVTMRQLTGLVSVSSRISDLTGSEHAISLTTLLLHGNEISDLRPLTPLVNLTRLRLHTNQINDLSPIANLTELTTLLLGDNNITDISPLANLTQLTTLILSWNNITDISPLANLINLERLELQRNQIVDHSPVDTLSLTHFEYDQSCDLPPEPLEPRLNNRSFPSIFASFGEGILNRPDLESISGYWNRRIAFGAEHDMFFSSPDMFAQWFMEIEGEWHLRGWTLGALDRRDRYFARNPNMIFLAEVRIYDYGIFHAFPDDHPYWLRKLNGEFPDHGHGRLINYVHPVVQDIIVGQALAIAKCGLYDGVFFDHWNDFSSKVDERLISDEDAVNARENIIRRIREGTRDNFLIIGNTNDGIIPLTGPMMNGSFMESIVPSPGIPREPSIRVVRESLEWLETNLREPRTVMLQGGTDPSEPSDSPYNQRLMRATTTMSLTHSDGYTMFGIDSSDLKFWYDFWDADLGRPLGEKFQFYEEIEGLYIREFTNGWAVYNQSGEAQVITLPDEVQSVASRLVNTKHPVQHIDGDIFLKVEPANPADVNGDDVVNIFDLTLVAQAMGTDKPEADVNGDGVVNVFDLVFVANQF